MSHKSMALAKDRYRRDKPEIILVNEKDTLTGENVRLS